MIAKETKTWLVSFKTFWNDTHTRIVWQAIWMNQSRVVVLTGSWFLMVCSSSKNDCCCCCTCASGNDCCCCWGCRLCWYGPAWRLKRRLANRCWNLLFETTPSTSDRSPPSCGPPGAFSSLARTATNWRLANMSSRADIAANDILLALMLFILMMMMIFDVLLN